MLVSGRVSLWARKNKLPLFEATAHLCTPWPPIKLKSASCLDEKYRFDTKVCLVGRMAPLFSCWNFPANVRWNYDFQVSMLLSIHIEIVHTFWKLNTAGRNKKQHLSLRREKSRDGLSSRGLDFGFFAFQPLKEANLPHGLPRFFLHFFCIIVWTEKVEGKLSDMNMKQFFWVVWCNFERGEYFSYSFNKSGVGATHESEHEPELP